jgi:hypothetical protein
MKWTASIFFFLLLFAKTIFAQPGNIYHTITDPQSLGDLSTLQPVRCVAQLGLPQAKDVIDGFSIIASDTGSGIITHIWATTDAIDSTTHIKLWIDDSLISSSTFQEFFTSSQHYLRAPLDTTMSGGFVCDVQMPYRHNFRITYSGGGLFFYAIVWRPYPLSTLPESFSFLGNSLYKQYQQQAENNYRSHPKQDSTLLQITFDNTINPKDTFVLAKLEQSAIIRMINFLPVNMQGFDSLCLIAYWDDFTLPAIDIPLSDFFCSAGGIKKVRSYFLTADSTSGLTSFFLMPFAKSARIAIINSSSTSQRIAGSLKYQTGSIDRLTSGYFHAVYHETNPTRYGVWHPILHERGEGRYIGTVLEIPHIVQWSSLEGNPRFVTDSSDAHSFEFTGTEDYFNGGWYFRDGIFSLPFAGCINYPNNLYRLHVFDGIDFTKSIDVDIQHGNNNDVHEDYRTVAFYYLHHTPFRSSRDTIRAGEHWVIEGEGYNSNEIVSARLGNYTLFDTTAVTNGTFQIDMIVPANWLAGTYSLSINGEVSPQQIVILQQPALQIFSDLSPITISTDDTLIVQGFGFAPSEKVNLFLGTTPVETVNQIVVTGDYHFRTIAKIPRLLKGNYILSATGNTSGTAIYPNPIPYTGILNYEFEDLLANSVMSGGQSAYERVSYYWYAKWSKQAFALFQPHAVGDSLVFQFTIPFADSFKIILFATKGQDYGDFMYSVDGTVAGSFSGYNHDPYFDPLPFDSVGIFTMWLSEGDHLITFVSKGKNNLANNNYGGFDHMILLPSSSLATVSRNTDRSKTSLTILPNPASTEISILSNDSDLPFALYNMLGVKVQKGILITGENKLSIMNLPAGVYFIRPDTKNICVPFLILH